MGELMYAYTSCRPDIGYAVTVLSKFTTCPSKIHYQYLRRVALYLKHTKTWGIMFHRESPSNHTDLQANDEEVDIISLPTNFLSFPDYPKGTNHDCYVDAVYANDPRPPNDLRKRRSTTGFANSLAGGAVVYRSKTQTVTTLSSTEADFFSAVATAKHVLYIRSLLQELGFPPTGPTKIYEDNEACIKVIDARQPTERTRHIDTPFYRIQDWKDRGDIEILHLPGIINPSDDLTKPLGWVMTSINGTLSITYFIHTTHSNKSTSITSYQFRLMSSFLHQRTHDTLLSTLQLCVQFATGRVLAEFPVYYFTHTYIHSLHTIHMILLRLFLLSNSEITHEEETYYRGPQWS